MSSSHAQTETSKAVAESALGRLSTLAQCFAKKMAVFSALWWMCLGRFPDRIIWYCPLSLVRRTAADSD